MLTGPGTTRLALGSVPGTPAHLVDQYGRAFTDDAYRAPRDPLEKASRADAGIIFRDIPVISPTAWTVAGMRSALDAHTIGMFAQSAQLVDATLGDDRVQATLGSRTGGLFGQPEVWLKADGDKDGSILAAQKLAWKKAVPQAVASEILRWGIMAGFCLVEILWDTTVTPWQPYLKPWHASYIFYRLDLRRYIAITRDGNIEIEPGNGKWLLYVPHGEYRGWMHGAVRSVAMPWLVRGFALRDWARYSERHGLPMLKAVMPARGNAEIKKKFVEAVANLGAESVIACNVHDDKLRYDLEMVEALDRSWESFKALIDRCDTSIVLPLLWQNLTTEVKEGSFAAARAHGDVRQNAIEFDNNTISPCLHQQLWRAWAFFNYGDPELAAYREWDVEPPEDARVLGEVFREFATAIKLLRDAGVEPTSENVSRLAKRLGVDIGELTLGPLPALTAASNGKTADKEESREEGLEP